MVPVFELLVVKGAERKETKATMKDAQQKRDDNIEVLKIIGTTPKGDGETQCQIVMEESAKGSIGERRARLGVCENIKRRK